MASRGAFWASWGLLGCILGHFGPPEASWGSFSASWGHLGASGASWGLPGATPGASWAAPGLHFGLLGPPFGRLLGPSGASWGLPWPPGAPQEAQQARKNDDQHEKSCILRVLSLKISPNPRFGCIFDPKNAAKSSENVFFFELDPRILRGFRGSSFTFFRALGSAKPSILRVFSRFKAEKTTPRGGRK